MTELIYSELTYNVRGAFFDVFNELHHFDLSESGWENALVIALQERGISVHSQAEYELHYKRYRIGRFFVDVLADERLVIELKARAALLPVDKAQVITYLKVTGMKLGILVNFGGDELEIIRIPNFVSERSARSFLIDSPSSNQWLYPALTGQLRAVLYEVHSELGPGFMHMHYRRAIQIELGMRSIPYKVKKEIVIPFHQQPVETRETRLIIVDDRVLLASIAVLEITPKLRGRFRQYLKILDIKIGLVANFYTSSLEIEVVRI